MNIIRGTGGLERLMIKKNKDTLLARELTPNELSDSAKKSMFTRVISAIVMAVLFVPAIVLGDWIYFFLMTIVLAIACYEILGCAGRRSFVIYIVYLIIVLMIAIWPMFKGIILSAGESGGRIVITKVDIYFQAGLTLPIIMVVIGFFLLFWLTVIYKDFSVVDASFLMTMAIVLGLGFQCLFYLRFYPINAFKGIIPDYPKAFTFTPDSTIRTSLLLIFVILSTILTDIGAYFVGVFFGKHKMNERISPKKTWEGFFGGIVISFVLTSSIGLIFSACNYPILPIFTIEKWYLIVILSFLIPFFATLGDFVFSAIKRYWGIKDYGNLIPGHGGVLDRLDSLFFASIVASIFISIFMVAIANGNIDWTTILV